MTFEPFDVVTFAFPYVERAGLTKRPAVVLSGYDGFGALSGIVVVAMITSARHSSWPLDVPLSELPGTGLRQPCLIRMKLNSASYQRVDRRIGALSSYDRAAVSGALRQLLTDVL